jgi:hypothetical protein
MNRAMWKGAPWEQLEGELWELPAKAAAMRALPAIAAGATVHIDLGAGHHHGSSGQNFTVRAAPSGAWAYRYRNETLVLCGPMSVADVLGATSAAVQRECVRNYLILKALSTAYAPASEGAEEKARENDGFAPLPIISAEEAARVRLRYTFEPKGLHIGSGQNPENTPAVLEFEGDVLAGVTAAQMAAEMEQMSDGGTTQLVAWRTTGARKYRLEWSETFC